MNGRLGRLPLCVSALFEPLTLRGVTARNRIWVAPMCQYSCLDDGMPTDWHLVHLGGYATGGFGLVLTEASAVVPEGRISPQDAGIWSDEHIGPWRRIVDFMHAQGTAVGMQLAHAGRKASTHAPLAEGSGSVLAAEGGWSTLSSTGRAFGDLDAPAAMTREQIASVPTAFAAAARRADEAGFDVLELHAAHGYLLHQFASPLVNDRTDEYGGSFENRTRLVVEVVDAVREAWPADKPLFVRFSATDWVDGGWDVDQTARLAALVEQHGVDLIDVSSGGAVPEQQIEIGPGYQVPFARVVRDRAALPVAAVGLITEPAQAEQLLTDGSADAVLLGRAALRESGWPLRAAHELGVRPRHAPYPPQYLGGVWRHASASPPPVAAARTGA